MRNYGSSPALGRLTLSPMPTGLRAYQTSRLEPSELPESLTEGAPPGLRIAPSRFQHCRRYAPTSKRSLHTKREQTPGVQACLETLALGSGSCRDLAWLLIEVVRELRPARSLRLGLSAEPPIRDPRMAQRMPGSEVYFKDYGWIGFDPTVGRPYRRAAHCGGCGARSQVCYRPFPGPTVSAPKTQVDLSVKVRVEAQTAN